MHYDRVSISFSIKNKPNTCGVDSKGKPIEYKATDGSKSFEYCPNTYESCYIDCQTLSPEKKSLYASLTGSISLSVSEGFTSTNIQVDSQSFSCYFLEKP